MSNTGNISEKIPAEQNAVKKKILVIQGPNLNLLGEREPGIYGSLSMEEVHLRMMDEAVPLRASLSFLQSNHEGEIIDRIHECRFDGTNGIIINAGGLTHTSVSLADALASVRVPYIEIHVSNVFAREEFRHHSYLSPKASGVIAGCGTDGYSLSLIAICRVIDRVTLQ
jgi:3-dehydroquinate dehydratase II